MPYYLILTDKGIVTKPVQANTPAELADALAAEVKAASGKAAAIELVTVADVLSGAVPQSFTDSITNKASIVTKANNALAANATFLALSPPSNAQTLTQVQALTRQMNALIKLTLGQLNDTTGT